MRTLITLVVFLDVVAVLFFVGAYATLLNNPALVAAAN